MNQQGLCEPRVLVACGLCLGMAVLTLIESAAGPFGWVLGVVSTSMRICALLACWRALRGLASRSCEVTEEALGRPFSARATGEIRRERRRRERLRNAGGHCSATAKVARWELYGSRCWVCHAPASHSDHVIALARGGGNWPANIRPACRRCNCSKGANDWRTVAGSAKGLPVPGRLP